MVEIVGENQVLINKDTAIISGMQQEARIVRITPYGNYVVRGTSMVGNRVIERELPGNDIRLVSASQDAMINIKYGESHATINPVLVTNYRQPGQYVAYPTTEIKQQPQATITPIPVKADDINIWGSQMKQKETIVAESTIAGVEMGKQNIFKTGEQFNRENVNKLPSPVQNLGHLAYGAYSTVFYTPYLAADLITGKTTPGQLVSGTVESARSDPEAFVFEGIGASAVTFGIGKAIKAPSITQTVKAKGSAIYGKIKGKFTKAPTEDVRVAYPSVAQIKIKAGELTASTHITKLERVGYTEGTSPVALYAGKAKVLFAETGTARSIVSDIKFNQVVKPKDILGQKVAVETGGLITTTGKGIKAGTLEQSFLSKAVVYQNPANKNLASGFALSRIYNIEKLKGTSELKLKVAADTVGGFKAARLTSNVPVARGTASYYLLKSTSVAITKKGKLQPGASLGGIEITKPSAAKMFKAGLDSGGKVVKTVTKQKAEFIAAQETIETLKPALQQQAAKMLSKSQDVANLKGFGSRPVSNIIQTTGTKQGGYYFTSLARDVSTAPKSSSISRIIGKTRMLQVSRGKSAVAPGFNQYTNNKQGKLLIRPKLVTSTGLIERAGTRQETGIIQIEKPIAITTPKLLERTTAKPALRPPTVPVTIPHVPFIPGILPKLKGAARKPTPRIQPRSFIGKRSYQPQVASIILGLRGRKPKTSTGLEIRPLVLTKTRKRRKR